MKLNENFVLKNIAGSPVVMPVGEAVNSVRGMIKLNPTAEVIWKSLEAESDFDGIFSALKNTYKDIDDETLKNDINYFLGRLREYNILID